MAEPADGIVLGFLVGGMMAALHASAPKPEASERSARDGLGATLPELHELARNVQVSRTRPYLPR